ncbi:hypothetical protein DL93DRAFT_2227622, partial [Clavulina sp. PMI_390]
MSNEDDDYDYYESDNEGSAVGSGDEHLDDEYYCYLCPQITDQVDSRQLVNHLQDEHLTTSWGCTLCAIQLHTPEEEHAHSLRYHDNIEAVLNDSGTIARIDASYTCPICNSSNASLWMLSHHLRIVHDACIRKQASASVQTIGQQLAPFGFDYDLRFHLLLCTAKHQGVPICDVPKHVERCKNANSIHNHPNYPNLAARLASLPVADVNSSLPIEIEIPISHIPVEEGVQCPSCRLAFSSTRNLSTHITQTHPGVSTRSLNKMACKYQQWMGGDAKYRNVQDAAHLQWRYVVVLQPDVLGPRPPDSALEHQIGVFDNLLPPQPTGESPPPGPIDDRRELGAFVNRFNIATLSTAEHMRALFSLSHIQDGTALQDVDLLPITKQWLELVAAASHPLPDSTRCRLMTTSRSDPSKRPFNGTVQPNTLMKRARLVRTLVIFSCALEHIISHPVPAQWNWGSSRIDFWKAYVALFATDPVWTAIRAFKEAIRDTERRLALLGPMIWALLKQGMRSNMTTWDCIFERFVLACTIDSRSIANAVPRYHGMKAIFTLASEISWIARASAVMEIEHARALLPDTEYFAYDSYYESHIERYLSAYTDTPFGNLRAIASWLSGVVANLDQMSADGYFAWCSPAGGQKYSHYTWKGQQVSVDGWYRLIPGAALKRVQDHMADFLAWVDPHDHSWYSPLVDRIRAGLGMDPTIDYDALFMESPNDSASYLTMSKEGLVQFSGLLKTKLAAQSRLVVEVNGHGELLRTTRHEFLEHVARIVKALFVAVYVCVGPLPRGTELALSS